MNTNLIIKNSDKIIKKYLEGIYAVSCSDVILSENVVEDQYFHQMFHYVKMVRLGTLRENDDGRPVLLADLV